MKMPIQFTTNHLYSSQVMKDVDLHLVRFHFLLVNDDFIRYEILSMKTCLDHCYNC